MQILHPQRNSCWVPAAAVGEDSLQIPHTWTPGAELRLRGAPQTATLRRERSLSPPGTEERQQVLK